MSKIRKKSISAAPLLLVAFMIISILGACEVKKGDASPAASPAKTASAAASSSAKLSSAKSTVSVASATASAVKTTAQSGQTSAAASGTGDQSADASETDEGTEETDETGKADTADNGGQAAAEEVIDLKGREIKIAVWTATLVPSAEVGHIGGPKLYELMMEAEKKFNCKFLFEMKTSESQIKTDTANAVLAGVYYADMIRINRASAMPLIRQNVFLAINKYIDVNVPYIKQYQDSGVNGLIDMENVYALHNSVFCSNFGVFYNKDIFSREGIPELQEYAAKGNWNWETYLDVARRTTRDFNGDGIIDQWGSGSLSWQSKYVLGFMYANAAEVVAYDKSKNKYIYNLNSTRAINALQFLSDLMHVYKVVPNKNALNDFMANTVAMYIEVASTGISFQSTYKITDQLGWVEVPRGPDNPGNKFMYLVSGHYFFYPATCKDPGNTIKATAYWQAIWDETKSIYLTAEEMIRLEAKRYFYPVENVEYFTNLMLTDYSVKGWDYVNDFSPASGRVQTAVFAEIAKQQQAPKPIIDAMTYEVESIIEQYLAK